MILVEEITVVCLPEVRASKSARNILDPSGVNIRVLSAMFADGDVTDGLIPSDLEH